MANISHNWSCLKVTSISSTSLNSFHGEIRVFLNHVKVTRCYRHGYNNVNGFYILKLPKAKVSDAGSYTMKCDKIETSAKVMIKGENCM